MKAAESILKALAEPVLILNKSMQALMANPAFYEVLGIAPGQLEGKSVQELIAAEEGDAALRSVLQSVMAHDRDAENVEIVCTIPPGKRKVLALRARRLAMDESPPEMILVELHDVTRERESEGRIQELNVALQEHAVDLEKINKDLEAFTQSVSHDLRTPLRLTNKVAHLLLEEDGAQLPASAIEKTHMILDSTRQMGQLIEDLLAFSRVPTEPMKKRRIDTRRLAREALAELRDVREDRDVEVLIDELPPCRADRALLKQVFLNLLANALKFTRQCERVEVRVGFTETNGETVYFVRDNGVGFDMSHSESIFLAFHRLNRARDFEGSGVGLALVKRIIERHNGRIWAESVKECGATFYFTLGE